jgi:hypothetical protein
VPWPSSSSFSLGGQWSDAGCDRRGRGGPAWPGLRATFVIPGFALLSVAALTGRVLRLPKTSLHLSRTLVWPEPAAVLDSDSSVGPVLVEVQWWVPEQNAQAFVTPCTTWATPWKRTGAILWACSETRPIHPVPRDVHGRHLARASAPAPGARHGMGPGTGGSGPHTDRGRLRAGGPAPDLGGRAATAAGSMIRARQRTAIRNCVRTPVLFESQSSSAHTTPLPDSLA